MELRQTLSITASKSGEILRGPRIAPHLERATEAMRHPKEALPEPAIRALGAARGIYWRTLHPLTYGAAVAVTDIDLEQIALVRLKYGDRKLWQLPGGGLSKPDRTTAKKTTLTGVKRLNPEIFEPSARREAKEEVGLDVGDVALTHLFNFESHRDMKGRLVNRDTLGIFHVPVDFEKVDLTPQHSEIAEIKLWDLDDLPSYGARYLGRVALAIQDIRETA
jgi:8-oxo-dGTP pyrophosphatase MutT (NUDIX family)